MHVMSAHCCCEVCQEQFSTLPLLLFSVEKKNQGKDHRIYMEYSVLGSIFFPPFSSG